MIRFHRKDGLCTVYALACGYLNATRVADDPQAITMGAEGAVYFVKQRGAASVWSNFPRNPQGYRDAIRLFRALSRVAGLPAARGEYSPRNPKIDIFRWCDQDNAAIYLVSTAWYRTCRDALAGMRDTHPGVAIYAATIDRRN